MFAAQLWVAQAWRGLSLSPADLATPRQAIALAASLTWLGTGLGGILMGWVADRIGVRSTVIFGAVNIGLGLAVSTTGGPGMPGSPHR